MGERNAMYGRYRTWRLLFPKTVRSRYMVVRVRSVANVGLKVVPVEVEVEVAARGLPALNIVGLPSKAMEEAKERVKAAIINSGASFPNKKITVNLAPAD